MRYMGKNGLSEKLANRFSLESAVKPVSLIKKFTKILFK